jgi:hypothetical protein
MSDPSGLAYGPSCGSQLADSVQCFGLFNVEGGNPKSKPPTNPPAGQSVQANSNYIAGLSPAFSLEGFFDSMGATGEHYFNFSWPLCDDCTTRQGFEAMRNFSGPGAPYAQAGTHPVTLWGGMPIVQKVDVRNMTITNIAQRGHIYGGQVRISMERRNGVVSARIVGSGRGPNAGWNQFFGPKIFRVMAIGAYSSLHPDDGGVPVVP